MRINDLVTSDNKSIDSSKARRTNSAALGKDVKEESASAVKGDSVELSSKTREMQEIALQLKQSSEVRQELVSELKQKIDDGTYKVSGLEVAQRIVNKAINNIY
jgi:negative regulator of flagellin synthesis FlgM